jgi:ABC-type transport system substrate-binding protein
MTSEQIASGELRSIGIKLSERPLPTNVIFGPNGFPSGDFDIGEFREYTTGDPGDWYENYRCFGSANDTGYCSHAVDALLKAAGGELNSDRRARLFQRADAIMATQVPIIPMYQEPIALIHRSDLIGMRPSPGSGGPVWNIEHWRWRK